MRSPLILGPFDLDVLRVLRDDNRRWLTVEQIRAALALDDTPRERTRVLASLSWMGRPRAGLITRARRELALKTVYALTTRGESELNDRAQGRLVA